MTPLAKAWPVNLDAARECRAIAFCEGGPDLLAALHFIESEAAPDVAAVAMLGAANGWLAADCLGADVDGFSVATLERSDGRRGKDLNDLLYMGADSFETFPEQVMP